MKRFTQTFRSLRSSPALASRSKQPPAVAAKKTNPSKDLYRQLRTVPWLQLWEKEVPRFDQATPQERVRQVALIRALGAGFAEFAPLPLHEPVRAWLRRLLQDPEEKIRRYALTALPKTGASQKEESQILSLLQSPATDREKKHVSRALEKIGGAATLAQLRQDPSLPRFTEQRAKANLARQLHPTSIRMDSPLPAGEPVTLQLRCRPGFETILAEELTLLTLPHRRVGCKTGLLTLSLPGPFCLTDLYGLRCFSTLSFLLGAISNQADPADALAIASALTSPLSQRLLTAFTQGPLRYRLEFLAQGHRRGLVHTVVKKTYALWPELLNDSREAPWAIEIHPGRTGQAVELRPRLTPDPRFPYRQKDVPAASHPPLAASLARWAQPLPDEVVWDPFCGSGLELIERTRLGGVRRVLGTDLSPGAIAAARINWKSAGPTPTTADFHVGDFRDFAKIRGWAPGSISLILTNPPLGKRVPIPDRQGLFRDLYAAAASALRPGGRMVWINPLKTGPTERSLRLESSQPVDLGGFACRLERIRKI